MHEDIFLIELILLVCEGPGVAWIDLVSISWLSLIVHLMWEGLLSWAVVFFCYQFSEDVMLFCGVSLKRLSSCRAISIMVIDLGWGLFNELLYLFPRNVDVVLWFKVHALDSVAKIAEFVWVFAEYFCELIKRKRFYDVFIIRVNIFKIPVDWLFYGLNLLLIFACYFFEIL